MEQKPAVQLEADGFDVDIEKNIGLTWPVTRASQIKRVDILAIKPEKTLIIEIEDLPSKRDGERGVSCCELGGIILLCAMAAQKIPREVTLRLIFRSNIVEPRRSKIEQIIEGSCEMVKPMKVEVEYHE